MGEATPPPPPKVHATAVITGLAHAGVEVTASESGLCCRLGDSAANVGLDGGPHQLRALLARALAEVDDAIARGLA